MHGIQNWLDRFCHKHPRLAIPHLMKYIAIGTVVVFLLDFLRVDGGVSASLYFSFSRNAILNHGQIWRLITFIFVPHDSNFIWVVISIMLYYFIGNTLEREWGSAKFTIYYFVGVIFSILVGFIVGFTTIYYVNMALFFAFATLYPDFQILLFFIIPVKIKWLAWLNGGYFVIEIIRYLLSGYPTFALVPMVALLTYFLFFSGDLLDFVQKKTKSTAHKASRKTVDFHTAQQHVKEKKGYLHKCAVCGKTDVSNPELEFRYCSKCNGYYCYCSEHLNTHVHIE